LPVDFAGLIPFVLITSFTPGPNNVSGASMGILYGYRRTLRYLIGIAAGVFGVMLLCGWLSSALLSALPAFEGILRVAGAIYILWLAYHTLKASYTFEEGDQPLLGMPQGALLQLLNPKAIIYGLTLYGTFLSGIGSRPSLLVASALAFAAVAFIATSSWALFGAAIRTYLGQPRVKQILNTVLALFLVYTAVELSGVLELV